MNIALLVKFRLTCIFILIPFTLSASDFSIPTRHAGISFGNSKQFTGIRFNFRDTHVQEVRGINITFWAPGKNPDAKITGLALGLVSPQAKYIHGMAAGLGVSADHFRGLGIGVLGMGGETIHGVCIGGLGLGGKDLHGLLIGGLGVGGETIRGLGIGGLGIGGEDLKGVFLGGLGVGGNHIRGFAIGMLGVGGQKLQGVMLGGLALGGDNLEGAMIAGAYLKAKKLKYFGAAGLVRTGQTCGVSVALVNITNRLNGLQLGLFNWAGNNPPLFRLLPLLNMHFE